MAGIWAICKKEFWGYFNSLIAYFFTIIFLGAVNFLYVFMVLFPNGQLNLSTYFDILLMGMWFIIPAITMKSWAEEKKLGTDELLLTFPLKDWDVVLGKFLAGFLFFGLILALSFVVPLSASLLGKSDWGVIICGYLGLLLVAGAFLAIGQTMSSFTKSQAVAFVSSLLICLLLLGLNNLAGLVALPKGLSSLINYLDVGWHFDSIARAVIDTRDIVFYLSLMAFFLVLNKYWLDRRKWA